ncbi:hypothetical protein [Mycobacterium kansasii]|uniref:hypothetical protein n=1 Tax=Mycobacterium kansasii TaxID=1768 RepID=UPI001CE2E603|nr:hypothetical protein [Mycobacterium kansasii]UCA22894.1 hypothetical protein LA359_28625 [Mycobacterium kansasii]
MSTNAFAPQTEESDDNDPPLYVGYNRDRSIIVTYSYYGFVGVQLTEATKRFTETSLATAIVEVAHLAQQRARAALRELQLAQGASRSALDRYGMPTHQDVAALQERIEKDPDL